METHFLILLISAPFAASQLSLYGSKLAYIRYCETVQRPTNLLTGGVTCGSSAWNAMSNLFSPLQITSNVSLGLINVGWITSEALRNQTGFWKTCKPYLVRLFDGIYTDSSKACALIVNPPAGLPNCTETANNFLYRSGSGYCLKQKVCGASATIDFLAGPNNSSLIYSWSAVNTNLLLAQGYKNVGQCYGYRKVRNPSMTSDTMVKADEGFY